MENESRFQNITADQMCSIIDLLSPSTDDYLYVYDFLNDFYYISAYAQQRFRLPCNIFWNVQENLKTIVWPDDMKMLQEDLDDLQRTGRTTHSLVYRWISVDGDPVWINCRGYVVRNENAYFMIGCINEIGDKPMADNVSGLLGEASMKHRLDELNGSLPDGFFLRLGLDNFKGINEKYGSDYGDMVLRKTAECIQSCILPGQSLYRIVADEFMILDLQGRSKDDAQELYKNIRRALDQFVEDNGYEAFVTISGGILACSEVDYCSWSDIMKFSEFALNEAKRLGKNRCYHFFSGDYENFMKRKRLTQALRKAVNNQFEGFEAHFQPLIYADNDQLYGAETLMRFHTEELGNVSPVEFIPILEETGLIIPAGRWILDQALAFCKMMQNYMPDFKVSVNLSYEQVQKSDLMADIEAAIQRHGVPYSSVIFELTESGLLDRDSYFAKLWEQMKAKGIMLALDDFGTGYSNFHYLHQLKPDIIKINRSFTAQALENEYEYNLLSLLGGLVHSLKLKMCVEGIETAEELKRIRALPPDYNQGFYFGRPCSVQAFVDSFVKEK